MSLFSIETAPVPLDAETYLGEKREYTQIIPETELIALTENNYIPLTQAQISLCAKIGYMYYCEYAHLLKKCTEHTYMSVCLVSSSKIVEIRRMQPSCCTIIFAIYGINIKYKCHTKIKVLGMLFISCRLHTRCI